MAFAFVQANDVSGSLSTTKTIAFLSNTVVGNRAILVVVVNSTTTAISTTAVSDAKNGSWHLDAVAHEVSGSNIVDVSIWSVQIATQLLTTDNITVTFSGSSDAFRVGVLEYSGLDTSATTAIDVSANTGGTTGSFTTGTTAATSAANELELTLYGDMGTGRTWTSAPSGTARVNHMGDSAIACFYVTEQSSGATGTKSNTGTLVGPAVWGGVIAIYKLQSAVTQTSTGKAPAGGSVTPTVFPVVQVSNNVGPLAMKGSVTASVISTNTGFILKRKGMMHSSPGLAQGA